MKKRILEEVNPKEILNEQQPNMYLYHNGKNTVAIISGEKWYTRLWYLISNPLRYLFTGIWKF